MADSRKPQGPTVPVSPQAATAAADAPRWRAWDEEEDEGADGAFKPLSLDEARAWRARHAQPWVRRVLVAQTLLALLAVALAALAQGLLWPARTGLVASVAWGGACALLPSLVMAWGLSGGLRARLRPPSAGEPRQALARWLAWEGVKVLLALAMLAAAPRVVADLDWLGLLAGLVVVLKGYALAWWLPRPR